ncbi:unnamed protein product [Echinostoma caproni]|uniref:Peptidase A2 domain-containing protein n=1 Tax=Echinostoma caproni TaxID=27848 RepID=A0A183B3F5_9TREM|nr:unnamed protein product [Echinostoma caproni]
MSAQRSLSDHNRLCGPNLRLCVTNSATGMGSPRKESGDYRGDESASPPTVRTRLPQVTFTAAPAIQLGPPPRFEAGTNLTLWKTKIQRFLRWVPTEEHSLCILDRLSDQKQELLINENVDEDSPQSPYGTACGNCSQVRSTTPPSDTTTGEETKDQGLLNPVAKCELQRRAPTTLGEAVRRVKTFDIQSLVKNEALRRSEEPKQASSSRVNGPRFEAQVPWRTKPQKIRRNGPQAATTGTNALVDTGATCSLIDVDQCQIRELSRGGPRVKAVNGSPLRTWGCLDVELQMTGTQGQATYGGRLESAMEDDIGN